MPLKLIKQINNQSHWGIWKIEEDIEELIALAENENLKIEEELKSIKQTKSKQERVASRLIIKALLDHIEEPYQGIYKDQAGKPHLIDGNVKISITHSYPFAAGMVHKEMECGIDIEFPHPQVLRIKNKFLNEIEKRKMGDDISKLCLTWCAKEVVYKIQGRKNVSFKKDMIISILKDGEVLATLHTDEFPTYYLLRLEEHEDLFVCYNID